MSIARPNVVLWDIDGTLLTTGRAGIAAWEGASDQVLGHEIDLSLFNTSGLTDLMIARQIVVASGRAPDPVLERKLANVYAAALPSCLSPTRGGVLPGVVEILDRLVTRTDTLLALLTGNVSAGARAKLACYGLDRYFQVGAFGEDGFERPEIGRVALQRAAEAAGGLDLERVYLVGDSPYDVACARALGIHMIAVATGAHGMRDLGVDEPWWLLERLPVADDFCTRLRLDDKRLAHDGPAAANDTGWT